MHAIDKATHVPKYAARVTYEPNLASPVVITTNGHPLTPEECREAVRLVCGVANGAFRIVSDHPDRKVYFLEPTTLF